MSQIYLNKPSMGLSMSAEEYSQSLGLPCGSASDCACGEAASSCPVQDTCAQEMICTCRPVAAAPMPPQVEEGCCCKRSFRAALGLLCDEQISSLLNFDAAAFVTNTYIAGAELDCGKHPGHGPRAEAEMGAEGRRHPSCPASCSDGASDNLDDLCGSFRRFAPCTCDLLDIDAELHTAGRKGCDFTATQVSLCQLDAVVIQGADACAECEQTAREMTARNFRCLRQQLAQRLNPCGSPCGEHCCSCASDGAARRLPGQSFAQGANDGPDCCCAAGLLSTLAQNNLSRRVSLVAGLLMLHNVTLLGTVGNVLVLANDTDYRLYFVCVNSVQFVG